MRYQITSDDLSNNAVYGNKIYVNNVEVTAPRVVMEGQTMSQVNPTDRYFTLAEFYPGPRPATISSDFKSWTYTMPTNNKGTFYVSLNYEMTKTKPPVTGYSLTTGEINTLKSQGASAVWVRGVTVTKTTKISAGDAVRIIAGEGKTWDDNPPAFINGDSRLNFTVDSRWADVTYSDNPSGDGWESLDIGTIVSAPVHIMDEHDIEQFTNSGVTLTNGGVNVGVGSPLRIGDTLVATAGNGRYFYLIPDDFGDDHPSIYMDYYNVDIIHLYFSLSDDKKTATLTIPDSVSGNDVYGFTCKTEQKTNVVGTNNVYLINEDILKRVNAKRFKTASGSDVGEITYDYGQFILSLLNIPFTVPADNIIMPEPILLANFNTGVTAPKINVDILTINLGSITVPKTDNNLYDYINTVALLHLPRMDSIAIELEYVIGHTISIEYLLDCYTGSATVNIYSDRINSPIITKSVNIGVNIPYANTHNNASLDNGNIEVGGDNGVTTAFIEIVKVDSILKNGLFTIPVVDEDILSDATGFIQVENVELKTSALRNEKEMLINILNNGVIIK